MKPSNLVVDLNLRRDVDAHNSTKVNLLVLVLESSVADPLNFGTDGSADPYL